ncbi:MAG: divergent polysaccharide deacetylase family protein [Rhodospirillaceae bacterium]|nr:divergent polysaccharide deacetylase family protein [Rhodospirillaceae bacterium]
MSKKDSNASRFRPNPKRQVILVLLALFGLGLGYGLGFVFKRTPPPAPEPKQPMHANNAQVPGKVIHKPTHQTGPQPVLPEPAASLEQDQVRAYEEALPKEIIVVMEPVTPATPKPITPEIMQIAPVDPIPATEPLSPPTETAHAPASEPVTWRKFAIETNRDGRPVIAIVMDDLGIDRARTRRTLELPGPLSLSFLAYAKDLNAQAETGRGGGHEIWLHVPMEPGSKSVDPGPNVLLTGVAGQDLKRSLSWNLDQLRGYVGINNHMGSRFTSDADGMQAVMAELKNRGLAFLDSVTSAKSVGQKAARKAGVPFALRNVFIDHEDNIDAINVQLSKVERLAKRQGHAIAIGHPRETTLKALTPWLQTLENKGFQLVPASSLLQAPEPPETPPPPGG